jgi:poly-gamma-glutamate synthesis protein (capsule biosynthesis protein)
MAAAPLAVALVLAAAVVTFGSADDRPAPEDNTPTSADPTRIGTDEVTGEPEVVDPATPATPATLPTPTTVPPGTASGEPITIAFGGDINYETPEGAPPITDPAARLRPMEPLLSEADLAVVNLETAITEGGTPVDKAFTFRAPPTVLDGLAANGVDVASLANNHGMDYGREGLVDSLAAKAESPVALIGIGADEDEAFAPHIADVKGQRVAVIGATQVLDDSMLQEWTATKDQGGLASAKRVDRLVQEVEQARLEADTVVVFLHWGIERHTCPSEDQQELALSLVDAGADVIVGGHAHRVQGGGRLGEAAVHYGLGNFAFLARSPESAATGVFEVTVAGRSVEDYTWHPGVIVDRVPYPLEGPEAGAALAAWDSLRGCTDLVE